MKFNLENNLGADIRAIEQYVGNNFRDKLVKAYLAEKERGIDFSMVRNRNEILPFIVNALELKDVNLNSVQTGYLIKEAIILLKQCGCNSSVKNKNNIDDKPNIKMPIFTDSERFNLINDAQKIIDEDEARKLV